ncbi:hypothetical protein HPB47_024798, partial [Ixodes persulcatus]
RITKIVRRGLEAMMPTDGVSRSLSPPLKLSLGKKWRSSAARRVQVFDHHLVNRPIRPNAAPVNLQLRRHLSDHITNDIRP